LKILKNKTLESNLWRAKKKSKHNSECENIELLNIAVSAGCVESLKAFCSCSKEFSNFSIFIRLLAISHGLVQGSGRHPATGHDRFLKLIQN